MRNQSPRPNTKPYSVFSYGAKNLDYEKGYSIGYITASEYCKKRFIDRGTLRKFVKRGWVLCTKGTRTRLSVLEVCTKEIDDYIML